MLHVTLTTRRTLRRAFGRPHLVVTIAVALALAACSSTSNSSSSPGSASSGSAKTNLTVAMLEPLSGEFAATGKYTVDGMQAAANYLNAGHAKAKNVHYVIEARDSQANPSVDAALARQLTQSGIRYFMGDDLTDTGLAAEQPVFNEVGAVSLTTDAGLPSKAGAGTAYPDIFGVGGGDAHEYVPFVNYFKQHGVKKLAILYANYQDPVYWGQGAAALAKQDGMQVATVSVPLTATSVTAQLSQLRSSGATALLAFCFGPTLGAVLVQGLNDIGWAPAFNALEGPTSQNVAQLPQSVQKTLVTGPTPTTFLSATANAQPTGLVASYFQYDSPLTGEKPGNYDVNATIGSYWFDAMLILDQAIAKAGSTDPKAVMAALESGTTFTGSRGAYTFSATNRQGPVTSDFGIQTLTAAGCPTGICQTASSS